MELSQPIPSGIFKSYDVRGLYPNEIDAPTVAQIARALVTMLRAEYGQDQLKIVVGGDMRVSTPELKAAVIEALIAHGVEVVDVGLVSTPTYYFAVAFYGYDGGIQVSASHNPKQYNGLKMVRRSAGPIGKGNGMEEIERLAGTDLSWSGPSGHVVIHQEILTDLMSAEVHEDDRRAIKPLKIVVDAANAMGALDVEAILKDVPIELVRLNFELDGTFPVHQPDPLDPKNLEILRQAVIEHHADLGIAPDGDGDRYFFVDERGEVVRQEILRGIMAQIALRETPGATVCYDIRPGKITKDLIEEAGGKAIVTRVGHSHIKKAMIEAGAVFGGESSGHYFYQFPFGTFEAPAPLVLKFLRWVSEQGKSLSEAVAIYRSKYTNSGEINSEVEDVSAVLKTIQEKYSDGEISLLDGVTVTYPDFWFNVRGSNTEPLIRLNLEATTPALMEEKRDEVLAIIRGS
jgi:phosphomannomutase